jgi:hypothetical protein
MVGSLACKTGHPYRKFYSEARCLLDWVVVRLHYGSGIRVAYLRLTEVVANINFLPGSGWPELGGAQKFKGLLGL